MSYAVRRIPANAVIDVENEIEITNWANFFGVSEVEVLRAVDAVGPSAAAVRDYLSADE
jgi:hypothetical protein